MTEPIESRLQALAKEFQYPPTPSVTDAVMSRLRAPVNSSATQQAIGLGVGNRSSSCWQA